MVENRITTRSIQKSFTKAIQQMNKLFIVVVGLALCCRANAQRPPQGPMSKNIFDPPSAGYSLTWEDNFDGKKLDSTKWKVRGVGARAIAYVSEDAVKVEDGLLKLFALKKGDTFVTS